ncbi:tail fiber domain-containing protein [bacterium]|nr:tail fiber domain-containing protein [bacterium]
MFLNNYKTPPRIKYMPFAAMDNQVLDPSWNGVTGATGEGFPNAGDFDGPKKFVFNNESSNPIDVTLRGAVMRGPTGPSGPSGYMLANWWPYTAKDGVVNPGKGNQKIWREKYYIPQGVLGRDASGNLFPTNRYVKGTTGRYNQDDPITMEVSGNLILSAAKNGVGGDLKCENADINNCSGDADTIVFADNAGKLIKKNYGDTKVFSHAMLTTVHDRIGGATLNMSGATGIFGKILYSNKYTPGELTTTLASTYHGMFVHTHDDGTGEGKAYYSHAGGWVRLIDEATSIGELSDVDTSAGQVNGYVLKWDGAGAKWSPQPDGGSSGGGYWDLSGTKIYSDRPIGVGGPCPETVTVADASNVLFVNGNVIVKKNITAYYSDERLKTFKGTIKNPIEKIKQLNGYYFVENELAKSLGYNNDKIQVGVSAQEVEKVLPEIVTQAPVGKEYKTVWYEKLTPLLIECVKEQQKQIDELKILVASLMKK